VLYPSDANQTAQLVAEMADQKGIVYLRTTREKTPILYGPDERFPIGGSRVLRQSESDQVTVVGAGITLHEALKAADMLKGEGVNIRVIDLYSIKPVDVKTLRDAAGATGGRIVTVEDHWREGGLGAAVLDAFAGTDEQPPASAMPTVVKLAVHHMPDSATPDQELDEAGINAAAIVTVVKKLLGK
jgi:transketolase